ncbi:MAG TPA: hypothetical protein VLF66_13010 [Thermoanaerobaculia bacterium]|nr:hypothetical protein [Thermoanaerobaculia bacterium]
MAQARLLLEQGKGEKAANFIRHNRTLAPENAGAANALRALIEDTREVVRTADRNARSDGARILLCTARLRLRDEEPIVETTQSGSEKEPVRHQEPRVTPPEKLYGPTPRMPDIVLRHRYAAAVETQLIIDKEGCVTRVRPIVDQDYSTDRAYGLVEIAVETMFSWVFRPALLDNEPVAVYWNTTTSYRFQ